MLDDSAGRLNAALYHFIKKENPVKKKRSAKQLANDKRLGRMAKARAKLRRKKTGRKRTVGRKKTTYRKKRRKNTLRTRQTAIQRATNPKRKKRKVSAKSHLWVVFKCWGDSVVFLALGTRVGSFKWTNKKAKAIFSRERDIAIKQATHMAKRPRAHLYNIGVAPDSMTSAQIKAGCGGKA